MRISYWSSDVCSSDLLVAGDRAGEVGEIVGTDADDDRQHHHLDARTHDIAQHALGEERRPVPQREGDEDEARKTRQLELEDGDEELDREAEEGNDPDHHGENGKATGREGV